MPEAAAENSDSEQDNDTSSEPVESSLNVSDEEFLKMDFSDLAPAEESAGDDNKGDQENDSKSEASSQASAAEGDDDKGTGDDDDKSSSDEEGDTDGDTDDDKDPDGENKDDADKDADPDKDTKDPAKSGDDDKSADDKDADDKDKDKGDTDTDDKKAPTAEAQLTELFTSFKANGKDMKVDNIEDARTLMSMGANYNKKMTALKPHLKLVKMLENNELLTEEKLSYLIDLDKGNPEAIKKLVQTHKIDTLDLDKEQQDADYKPGTYTVHDKELELDSTLDDLKGTDSYATTVDIVSNKWDDTSRRVMLEDPKIIRSINDHVASGVFDKITKVMEHERMLGRLDGLSDLQAYKQTGDMIQSKGGFDKVKEQPNGDPKPKAKANDPKLSDRKRAAGSTKGSTTKKKAVDENFNPLALSDEDFEKQSQGKFL